LNSIKKLHNSTGTSSLKIINCTRYLCTVYRGATQNRIFEIKKFCWSNYSNFYPDEKVGYNKLWREILLDNAIGNFFFIDYYLVGLNEKSNIVTNSSYEMRYILSDN